MKQWTMHLSCRIDDYAAQLLQKGNIWWIDSEQGTRDGFTSQPQKQHSERTGVSYGILLNYLILTTVELIGWVRTVILCITLLQKGNALPRPALELVRQTGWRHGGGGGSCQRPKHTLVLGLNGVVQTFVHVVAPPCNCVIVWENIFIFITLKYFQRYSVVVTAESGRGHHHRSWGRACLSSRRLVQAQWCMSWW